MSNLSNGLPSEAKPLPSGRIDRLSSFQNVSGTIGGEPNHSSTTRDRSSDIFAVEIDGDETLSNVVEHEPHVGVSCLDVGFSILNRDRHASKGRRELSDFVVRVNVDGNDAALFELLRRQHELAEGANDCKASD